MGGPIRRAGVVPDFPTPDRASGRLQISFDRVFRSTGEVSFDRKSFADVRSAAGTARIRPSSAAC